MPAPVSLRLQPTPKYDEFYGFAHPPFAEDRDARFVSAAGPHARALEALAHGIRAHGPIGILTGEPGSGTTAVCRALVTRVDDAVLTSLVLEPPASIDALLRTVLQDFGVISPKGMRSGRVAGATRQELADALGGFLRSLEPIGGRGLVVLDQAHRIDSATLRDVGGLAVGETGSSRLHIVLAGQPELVETLRQPDLHELDERIATRAVLAPLSVEDVAAYVTQRLNEADGPGVSFEPAALELIHRHSGGLPRAINALCDRTLALGAQLEVRTIGAEVVDEAARGLGLPAQIARRQRPRTVWIWAAALVLALVIAAWFSGAFSALFP